jgi:hypothetical protein
MSASVSARAKRGAVASAGPEAENPTASRVQVPAVVADRDEGEVHEAGIPRGQVQDTLDDRRRCRGPEQCG